MCKKRVIFLFVIPTLNFLLDAVKSSFTNRTHVKVSTLKYVYDFKAWIKDYVRTPANHTQPHAYKFEMNEKKRAWYFL